MKLFLSVFFILYFASFSVNAQKDRNKTYDLIDKNAEFPGGVAKLYLYLGRNIRCPEAAIRVNVSGKVVVKFTIKKNGKISNMRIIKGIGFGTDEEVIRVIKAMPRWQPAIKNGKKVEQEYTLPIFDITMVDD